jgi:hypothetical protein
MGITLDEVILDASTSSISISDGTDTLAVNADGSINTTVTATDLDIRDLVNTQDSVAIGDETNLVDMQQMDSAFGTTSFGFGIFGVRQDAGGSPVSGDGDAHPLVFNNAGELKVSANLSSSVSDDEPYTEMPIAIGGRGVSGALTALSATNDKFDILGDLYRRVWVNDSSNIGANAEAQSVGTTAAEALATPLAGRKSVTVQNNSNNSVYLGTDNTVTTANGMHIPKRSSATYPIGPDIDIWLIADAAATDVRLYELG